MEWTKDILDKLVEWVSSILPVLNVPQEFITKLDTAINFLITLLLGAGYFIPLDVFTFCIGSILTFNIAKLGFKVTVFIVKLVRG